MIAGVGECTVPEVSRVGLDATPSTCTGAGDGPGWADPTATSIFGWGDAANSGWVSACATTGGGMVDCASVEGSRGAWTGVASDKCIVGLALRALGLGEAAIGSVKVEGGVA